MKLKAEYEAFLDGYKPAILIGEDSKNIQELEAYPSILIDRNRDYMSHLFFQTETAKQTYMNAILDIELDSYEDHYLLGMTLGLPEKSVDYFARVQQKKLGTRAQELQESGVGIIWAGFSFSANVEDLIAEVKWMWQTYQHPAAIEHSLYLCPVGNDMLEVPYGDEARLEEANAEIREIRGLAGL
jgi:hypothetical protein